MKCPECERLGLRSRVYDSGSVWWMAEDHIRHNWNPYWDEDDVYHVHNPNIKNKSYECSNSHKFNTKFSDPCPASTCSFGRAIDEIEIIKPMNPEARSEIKPSVHET